MLKFIQKILFLAVFCLGLSHVLYSQSENLKIGIIGDSTVCLYPESNPTRGWGQLLPELFAPSVTFTNEAQGGRSTKTFPPDRWQRVLAAKPDFIFIQFGHNDSHAKDKPESTDAQTDFKEYLRKYVKETRDHGATAIFVTPPHRRIFNNEGKVSMELAPYANAMKEVGDELKVPVIDLFTKSGELFEKLGKDGSEPFTMNKNNPGAPNSMDLTHFSKEGALEMAKIVSAGAAEIDPRIKAALKK